MMRVAGDWLSAAGTQSLMRALGDAGHQVFVVGGCVRNALLGVPVSDVDISTSARPDVVTRIAEAAGFTAHPTGIDHGTITVVAHGVAYEVTTLRRDVETDGRRAVVAFADTIEEDARRRDFTMNALYALADGAVVDPLGGLPDLQARRVRFIEDAYQRIREDYLRILRFFRFYAHYGRAQDGLDPDGLAACAALSEGLLGLSKERVGAELLKTLSAPDPAPAMAAMEHSGCLHRVLPGAITRDLAPLVAIEDGLPPDPLRRLAALGPHDTQKALRLSKAQARELQVLSEGRASDTSEDELAYRHGAQAAWDVVLLRHASTGQMPDRAKRDRIAWAADQRFPVAAADLSNLSGPALGAMLSALESQWIGSGFAQSKSALLESYVNRP